jgi:hypothetical protein
MDCADDVTVKAKAATAINLIISFLRALASKLKRLRMPDPNATMQPYNSNKHITRSEWQPETSFWIADPATVELCCHGSVLKRYSSYLAQVVWLAPSTSADGRSGRTTCAAVWAGGD